MITVDGLHPVQLEILIRLLEHESQAMCSDGNVLVMRALDKLHAKLSDARYAKFNIDWQDENYRCWRVGLPVINTAAGGYQVVYTVFCYDPDDQTHVLVHTASSIDKALIWCAENALDGFVAENNPHGSLSIVEDYVDRADDECRFICHWHYLAGELIVSLPIDTYDEYPEWKGRHAGVEIEYETYYW